jgi:hypothetical protein
LEEEAFPFQALSLQVLTARHRDAIMGNMHGYWQRVCAQAEGRDEMQIQRVSSVAFGVAVSGRLRSHLRRSVTLSFLLSDFVVCICGCFQRDMLWSAAQAAAVAAAWS